MKAGLETHTSARKYVGLEDQVEDRVGRKRRAWRSMDARAGGVSGRPGEMENMALAKPAGDMDKKKHRTTAIALAYAMKRQRLKHLNRQILGVRGSNLMLARTPMTAATDQIWRNRKKTLHPPGVLRWGNDLGPIWEGKKPPGTTLLAMFLNALIVTPF